MTMVTKITITSIKTLVTLMSNVTMVTAVTNVVVNTRRSSCQIILIFVQVFKVYREVWPNLETSSVSIFMLILLRESRWFTKTCVQTDKREESL
jgi:hypothetical protein